MRPGARLPCLVAVLAVVAASCTSVDPEATVVAACPDELQFASVSPVMEASCGTLDCHGHPARPLRIYGERGLRLGQTDLSGEALTTAAERAASRRSICSLQPEAMASVAAAEMRADALLLVQKARGEAFHKGGAPVAAGDATDTCITTWLDGAADTQACANAPTPDP
ncbi:MAG: hypothetical protein WKG00_10485 [Polyangiaceae bacterium]